MVIGGRRIRYGKLVRGFDWRTTEERLQRINMRCESLGLTKTEYIQYAIDKESMGNPVFEIKEIDDYNVATVTYEDGSMFTVGDWQSAQPKSVEEIDDFEWYYVDSDETSNTSQWRKAIVLFGYPRMM
jgi:hypothetical protein